MSPQAKPSLPPFAAEYIAAQSGSRGPKLVRALHRWLRGNDMGIKILQPDDLERFLRDFGIEHRVTHTQKNWRYAVHRYLQWLHQRNLLRFEPDEVLRPLSKPLPPEWTQAAQPFLEILAPTHKSSTIDGYKNSLKAFLRWLDEHDVKLEELQHHHIEQWHRSLLDRGLHPSTRRSSLTDLRVWLTWLDAVRPAADRPPADELVRRSDMPKLPRYLPRPLPPDIDRELQRRLRIRGSHEKLGLLLMRKTGIRVGELIALNAPCVWTDRQGRRVLKVPLGKMDNERLVPITDDTHALIQALRGPGRARVDRPLVRRPSGKRARYDSISRALRQASKGLATDEPVTTHRLRHTFATEMLSAGVSIPTLMRLLGHSDHRMTLRYAAITSEVVRTEFDRAIEAIHQTPDVASIAPNTGSAGAPPSTKKLLDALIRTFANEANHHPDRNRLLRRLRTLQRTLHQTLESGKR